MPFHTNGNAHLDPGVIEGHDHWPTFLWAFSLSHDVTDPSGYHRMNVRFQRLLDEGATHEVALELSGVNARG